MKTQKWAVSIMAIMVLVVIGGVFFHKSTTATSTTVISSISVALGEDNATITVNVSGSYNKLYYYLRESGSKRFVASGGFDRTIEVEKDKTYFITVSGLSGNTWNEWSEWKRFRTFERVRGSQPSQPTEQPQPPTNTGTETPTEEATAPIEQIDGCYQKRYGDEHIVLCETPMIECSGFGTNTIRCTIQDNKGRTHNQRFTKGACTTQQLGENTNPHRPLYRDVMRGDVAFCLKMT